MAYLRHTTKWRSRSPLANGTAALCARARTRAALPWLVLIGLLALSAAFLISAPLQHSTAFSLGGVGAPLAQDFQRAETTPDGRGFRWTNGASTLRLPAQGSAGHALRLRLSAPRPQAGVQVPLRIFINENLTLQTTQDERIRVYQFVLPAAQVRWGTNTVRIESPTFAPQEQNRSPRLLGVAVFDVRWAALAPARWLLPLQIMALALALVALALLLARCAVPPGLHTLALLLFAGILLALRHSDSRFVYRWHALAFTLGVCALLAAALIALQRWPIADAPVLPLRRWRGRHMPALAGYSLLTALMLAPLLPHLTTHVLGAPGDNWEYVWKMHWFAQALIERHTSPIFAPQLFFPNGVDLTSSEIAPAQHLLYVPFTLLFGPIVSYNINTLVSFVLSGFFTYLLAQRLGMRRRAAFVAGVIFAFSVRRFFHATGHFGITASQWVPLLVYAWEGVLARRRAWDAVLAGVAYALAVWSSMLYGVTLPLLLIVYTLVRFPFRALLPELRACWRPLVLLFAVAVALVAPAVQPYLEAQAEGLTYQHLYSQLALHATRPLDYLLPNPLHPLWGAWAARLYPAQGEQYGSPGYLTLVLSLFGIWLGRRRRAVLAIGAVLLLFAVLSFGPELPLADTWQLPLPDKWLYTLPVFGSIRTWGRMTLYVMLCAGVLAGVAVDRLLNLPRPGMRWMNERAAPWVWLVIIAVIMGEAASALPISSLQARAVDTWLNTQPGSGAVVNLPHKAGAPTEFLTLIYTQKPVSQGHGTFTPASFREAQDIYYGFPSMNAVQLLQRWQVDYMVVDEAQMDLLVPDWRAKIAQLPLVVPVYATPGYSVFRLQRS